MGNDLSVVNAARVSFDKESEWDGWATINHGPTLKDKDKKLINYLAKHNHFTPFTHATATFLIKCPIFVARQIHKSQVGFSVNEVSRRYVDSEPEFYIPQPRLKAENVKQGSSDKLFTRYLYTEEFEYVDKGYEEVAEQHLENSLYLYNRMIDSGIAPEVARAYLPQAAMTEFWMTGSLYAWARLCNLRLDSHAQAETREIATMISKEMSQLFPHSWKALVKEEQN